MAVLLDKMDTWLLPSLGFKPRTSLLSAVLTTNPSRDRLLLELIHWTMCTLESIRQLNRMIFVIN